MAGSRRLSSLSSLDYERINDKVNVARPELKRECRRSRQVLGKATYSTGLRSSSWAIGRGYFVERLGFHKSREAALKSIRRSSVTVSADFDKRREDVDGSHKLWLSFVVVDDGHAVRQSAAARYV